MNCPNCKNARTKITDTIQNNDNCETYRVHNCPKCKYSFRTIEFEAEYDDKFRRLWNRYYQQKYYKYERKKKTCENSEET